MTGTGVRLSNHDTGVTMEGDLQKQRRNLLVVSVLLIIQALAEVDISKISLLGTELKTEKVGVLLACFWVLWLYFLLRYYQYWREGNLATKFRETVEVRQAVLLNEWGQRRANEWFGNSRDGRWTLHRSPDANLELHMERRKRNSEDTENFQIKQVPMNVRSITKARALVWVSFQTTETTEHFLPFALALVAPIVSLAINWGTIAAVSA
jgi:hypothetical protein